jgi:4-hydroxybenzoyl-CoA thioesterase
VSYASNRMPLEIEWGHCDPAGIVYNPRFFEFFDVASWTLVQASVGVPRHELCARFKLVGIALVEAGANFIAPLKFGDRAEIVSTIAEIDRSIFSVRHHIRKDDKLMVDGLEKRVWAGPHPADPLRMRAMPIPDEIRGLLTPRV